MNPIRKLHTAALASAPGRCIVRNFAILFLIFGAALAARAQGTIATAQYTAQAAGGGGYNYDITLTDTGSNNIGTFWFGWVPGADFLPSNPTSVTPPAGWTDYVEGGYYGGYSIEFYATGAGLTTGNSMNFLFSSPDSPATLMGTSANYYYPHDPILTSYTYSGMAFSDAGNQFVVTPAPEPSTMAILFLGAAGLWILRRRQQLRQAGGE